MTKSQKQTSPVSLWFFGLGLILLWLAIAGQGMNQYLHNEQQHYARRLGQDNAQWITQTGNRLYAVVFVRSGVQRFLLARTTPDGQMGQGLARTLQFFQRVIRNFLNLIKLLLYRIAVLLACVPFWGVILAAAVTDGLLIRKIRYHDFHYTSPLQNLWSRRAAKWLPGLFFYLMILPLPVPVLLIPTLAWLMALSLGWWAANWQKKV